MTCVNYLIPLGRMHELCIQSVNLMCICVHFLVFCSDELKVEHDII